MPVLCNVCLGYLHEPPLELTGAGAPTSFDLIALKCGHIFHKLCVQQWFESDRVEENPDFIDFERRGKCPNCQQPQSISRALLVYPSYDESINNFTAQIDKWKKLEDENARFKELDRGLSEITKKIEKSKEEIFRRVDERVNKALTDFVPVLFEKLNQISGNVDTANSKFIEELDKRLARIHEKVDEMECVMLRRVEERIKKCSMEFVPGLLDQISGKVDTAHSKLVEELDQRQSRIDKKMHEMESEILGRMEQRLNEISKNCKVLQRMDQGLDDSKFEVLRLVEHKTNTLSVQTTGLKRQNEVGVAKITKPLTAQMSVEMGVRGSTGDSFSIAPVLATTTNAADGIRYGDVEAAKILVTHEADPSVQNEDGHVAFGYTRVTNEPDFNDDLLESESRNKEKGINEVDVPTPPPLLCHFSGEFIKAGLVQDRCVHLFRDENGKELIPAVVGWSNGEFYFGKDAKNQQINRVWKLSECFLSRNKTEPWKDSVPVDQPVLIVTFELLFALILKKIKTEFGKKQIGNCGQSRTIIIAHPFGLSSTQKLQIKNGAEAAGFKEVYLVNELHAAALSFAETRPGKNIMALGVSDLRIEALIFNHIAEFCNQSTTTYFDREPVAEVVGVRRKNRYSGQHEALVEELERICKSVVHCLQRKSESVNKVVPEEGFLICENEETRSLLENAVQLEETLLKEGAGTNLALEGLALIQSDPENMNKLLRNKQIWPIYPVMGGGLEVELKWTASGGNFLPVEQSVRIPVHPGGFQAVKFCEICLLNERYPIGRLNVTERWWREGVIIPTLEINSKGIVQLKDVKFEMQDGLQATLSHKLDYTWETPNLTTDGIQEIKDVVLRHCTPEFGTIIVDQGKQSTKFDSNDDDEKDNYFSRALESSHVEYWFDD